MERSWQIAAVVGIAALVAGRASMESALSRFLVKECRYGVVIVIITNVFMSPCIKFSVDISFSDV